MQFLVVAFDYKDAFERRMSVRPIHLELLEKLRLEGKCLYAAQLVDENNTKIIGSSIIFEYPSRKELEAMLADEPYTIHKVWETVQITRCNVAAMFTK